MDIKVKEQKKRWASCTKNNELLFNWRCVMAPSNILDYIVVHEMCHIWNIKVIPRSFGIMYALYLMIMNIGESGLRIMA